MKRAILNNWKGALLATVIAITAITLASTSTFLSKTLTALVFGVIVGNLVKLPKYFSPGLKFIEKQLLEVSIVLIGFGFQLSTLQNLGLSTFIFLIVSVVIILWLAIFTGKKMGCKPGLAMLMGAGSAICGSAAIAATAPLIKAKEEEIGLSLGIVNFLGLIGVVALPLFATVIDLNASDSGILIGGVLQSLGHVVASSYSLGTDIGDYATVVKMGRILLLIPLLLALYLLNRSKNKSNSEETKIKFPYFILLFAVAVVTSQLNFVSEDVTGSLAYLGDVFLCIAMAAIGIKIQFKKLVQISGKGVIHGSLLFLFQILIFVGFIYFF